MAWPASMFGACPCGGTYEPRAIDVTVARDDEDVILANLSEGVCPQCLSKVYKTEVLELIEATYKGSPFDPGNERSPV